jgi:biopolymer transport protein ExbD
MAFPDRSTRDPTIAEINIIPLCDVLLVLLIIFMVTAPALSYPVNVDTPGKQPKIDLPSAPPPPVHLRLDAGGQAYWNGEAVTASGLSTRMREAATAAVDEQPLLQIDVSGDCEYQAVARVIAQARNARLAKIGFVRQ